MSAPDQFNLRQAADALDLDRLRLIRLGHHLHLAPGDPCIPTFVIQHARTEEGEEQRYRLILSWLLEHQGPHALLPGVGAEAR